MFSNIYQIIDLCKVGKDVKKKVHDVIGKFAGQNLRSLAVAKQVSFKFTQELGFNPITIDACNSSFCPQAVPEKTKDSAGGPWQFVGLLPLFDPPRHDSAEAIRQALNLGVNVKMITGDQLAIGKETGHSLGMGTNMYPFSLLGQHTVNMTISLTMDEIIERAVGFAGVFPGLNLSYSTYFCLLNLYIEYYDFMICGKHSHRLQLESDFICKFLFLLM